MRPPLSPKFARSKKFKILQLLKENGPLSVPDLLKKIPLSYMGIKQHCVELERDGYLSLHRKPKTSGRGRPEQAYELTDDSSYFFPRHDTLLARQIITALRQLYGTSAPEKILYSIQQNRIAEYRQKMSAFLFEDRLREFIQIRERDGYFLQLMPAENKICRIMEYHNPIWGLMEEFPVLINFELQLYQKTLHPKARRLLHQKNPFRIIYTIPDSPEP